MTAINFGSVCSGIEAASLAFHPMGWRAAWLAEVDKFASAVLAHHYPTVPNLGDMTKIAKAVLLGTVPAPDVLCGGTPCQAFSLAGLRQSLADARGNLTLKFVELANAIDHVRAGAGQPAATIFWENVHGVLSTKDNAFGCFLAGLAGESGALEPPEPRPAEGKSSKLWKWDKKLKRHIASWANAGCVYGPKRAIAWRTLDAQFFGVPQRRRRVFVVASARDGFDPATVLFEWDGLRRDTAPSRKAREIAPTIPSRSSAGGGLGTDFDCDGGLIAGTLQAGGKSAGSATRQDAESGLLVTHSLRGEGFDASEDGTGRGTPLVPVAFAIQAGALRTNPASGPDGVGVQADHAYTLEARAEVQAIAVALRGRDGGATAEFGDEVGNCLRASNGGGDKPHVLAAMQVRRLTPTECERLMGMPDGYTQIPWRGKPADQCPDGPRYKALGNSWVVPNITWIGQRIHNAIT